MKNKIFFLRLFALFAVITIWFSCARNPVTGKRQLMFVSESQEKAMGLAYDPQVISEFGLYEDDKLQKFINDKGQTMGKISHRPTLDYQFRILDSPVVNAFAVPGGYVYFTRGIMAHFNNEAEFMGVLGHEIGHITARHSAKQQTDAILAQIGLIAGMVAVPEMQNYSDLAMSGLQLLFLSFSRKHESQSDELGVKYSTQVGYNSHEMANFFATIGRIQKQAGAEIPTFLSTHPDPGDRFNRVHQLSEKEQTKTGKKASSLKVNRDEYLRMIDGIVYGEDPRQGYVESGKFYHPAMKFEFPIPSNWQTENSAARVQIAPKDGKAVIIFTLGSGKTLNEAKQAAIKQDSLKVIDSQNIKVNGNDAIKLTADLNPKVRLLMYLIQYDGAIYKFTGLSETVNFNTYDGTFENCFKGFKALTDQSKLNVKPDVVRIKTVSKDGTLQETLKSFNVPQAKQEEVAILNSMELKASVKKGALIKVVEKASGQ
jgi:predicted Zn-dependent protease